MNRARMFVLSAAVAAFSITGAFAAETEGAPVENPNHGCTVNVAINKWGDPKVKRGEEAVHFIAIHNMGTCKLKRVHLADELSSYMKFKDASGDPYYTPADWGGTVKWKGEHFLPGDTAIVIVKFKVHHDAPRFLTNRACFTAQSAVSTMSGYKWCDTFTVQTYERDVPADETEAGAFPSSGELEITE